MLRYPPLILLSSALYRLHIRCRDVCFGLEDEETNVGILPVIYGNVAQSVFCAKGASQPELQP